MKDENQISGIGSFNLIWPPRSFMAQSVSLEGVSTYTLLAVVVVLTRTNEHTVAGVLFLLYGVLSLSLMILAGQILAFFATSIGHEALSTGVDLLQFASVPGLQLAANILINIRAAAKMLKVSLMSIPFAALVPHTNFSRRIVMHFCA